MAEAGSPRVLAGPRMPRMMLAALVIALAIGAVWLGRRDRPVSLQSSWRPSLSLTIHSATDVQAAIGSLGHSVDQLSAPLPEADPQQYVLGRIEFSAPRRVPRDRRLELFVIDTRTNQPVQKIYATSPAGQGTSGWNPAATKLADAYPWLAPLAPVQTDQGFTDPGMSVEFPASAARSPIDFVAVLDPEANPVGDAQQDLIVALALVGADDHVYWVARL